MHRLCTLILLSILVTSCVPASRYVMTYPMAKQSPDQVIADRAACENWAYAEARPDMGIGISTGAVVGGLMWAGIGAALGAVAGSFYGNAGPWAGAGAALGGVTGAMSGGMQGGESEYDRYLRAYRACMGGRGYSVQ